MKQYVNLIISLLVRAWDIFSNGLRGLVGLPSPARCVTLAYHAVAPAERSLFAQQMDVMLSHARAVPADIAGLPAGSGLHAAVTFDDGLENIIENALPVLKEKRIPATLFIVTEFLGRDRAWEHRGGEDTRNEQVMSEAQLRKLPSDLIAIGSHTMNHAFLPNLDRTQLLNELAGSRTKLESMLNVSVKTLSFPYGAFNDQIIDVCREAGYSRVFTALPTFSLTTANEFVSGRVGVHPHESPLEFRLKLAGAYRWLPYAYTLKRRLKATLRGQSAKPSTQKMTEKRVA